MHSQLGRRTFVLASNRRFLSANVNLLGVTLSTGIFLPFIHAILLRFHQWTSLDLSIIATLMVLGSKGGQILLGPLVDNGNKKTILVVSGIGYGMTLVLWLFVERLDLAILLTLLLGAMTALNILVSKAVVAQVGIETKESALGFSMLNVVVNVTSAIGAVLGGLVWLVDDGKVLIIVAASCPILTSILLSAIPWTPGDEQRIPGPVPRGKLRGPLGDRKFLASLPFVAVGFFFYAQLFTTLPFYLCVLPVPVGPATIGIIFAVNSLMIIALQLPAVRILDALLSLPEIPRTLLIFLPFVLSFVVLGISGDFVVILSAAVLFTVGEILFTPFVDTLTAGFASGDNAATYFSITTASRAIGDAVGGAMGVFLVTECVHSKQASLYWYLLGVLAVLLVLGLVLLRRFRARQNLSVLDTRTHAIVHESSGIFASEKEIT